MAQGTFTNSEQVLQYLQTTYGSADYKSWQSIRRQFYSFIIYPLLGINELVFFGSALGQGGITRQETNMPKAGSFGQNHFLLKSIKTKLFAADWMLHAWTGINTSTLYSDIINGFVQEGVLTLTIGARKILELPKPFMYAPNSDGAIELRREGLYSLTLSDGTPNVPLAFISAHPWATTDRRDMETFLVDPNVLIEAEQSFELKISFPSGAIPVIANDIIIDNTNPLKVGVILDGLVFRPVQ
jgi:hypothetical protein